MKMSYKISLISIGCLLIFSLATSFSYGVWLSNQEPDTKIAMSNECLTVILTNNGNINLHNPLSISDDDGFGSSAYPFTIENKCNEEKNIELRLDTLEGSTIESSKIKIYVNGDLSLAPTIIEKLNTAHTINPNAVSTNLLLSFTIPANKTMRGNARMWLSQDAVLLPDKQDFLSQIYFTTDQTIIKPNFKEVLLSNEGLEIIDNKPNIDFREIATTDMGLQKLDDTEGTSYYFRGNVLNNYVSFANYIWRIIRINGNGSIRMILDNSIANDKYNSVANDEKYVGYTYINNDENTDSNVKTIIDKWYQDNIVNNGFDKYLVTEYFCNDSSIFNTEGQRINYQEYGNLFLNYTPSLKCGNIEKDYGSNYRFKVGLITASETILAGATLNIANNNYYLYNGNSFMTMSPIDYYNGKSYVGIILNNGAFNNAPVNELRDIRPVINLSASTTVNGTGTIDDPYQIDLTEQ